jgi:Zn-dependent M28 family amino/carboxypeptidase
MKFPATIIFLTVAGEEQGLNGSKHFAEMAKQQGWKLEAVLNNDIVGGDRSPQQDAGFVRVFSEGVPAAASEAEIRRIRALGGESDSSSRELARYIAEVGRTYPVVAAAGLRLDRFCVVATTIHSISRDSRGCGLRSFGKITTTNIRTCAQKTASNMAICRSS